MKVIAFSPASEADIGGIWDYSANRWGLDQADSYVDAIRDACYALAKGTKRGRPAEVLPGFQKHLCGSHVIYFWILQSIWMFPHSASTTGC
jgi:toxin ParE1/3/4